MNELKYVTLIPKGMNVYGARAVIFNGHFNHKDMVAAILIFEQATVHGAGMLTLLPEVKVYGHSVSLGVGVKKEDARIIGNTLTHAHTIDDLRAYQELGPDEETQLDLFNDDEF